MQPFPLHLEAGRADDCPGRRGAVEPRAVARASLARRRASRQPAPVAVLHPELQARVRAAGVG
jgi:hypothetical protein